MTYTYSLSLDIKRDCWNWYNSTKDALPLLHSYENMLYGSGQQMFFDLQKCTSLKAAEKICLPFLKNLYQSQNYYQDNIKSLHAHLHQHFLLACAALEKITNQPLYFHHYPIYLTTFPRLPYSEKEGHFFFSAGDSGQRLIAVFLHEGLHLQFHHYYAQTPSLLQAKPTDEAWHALKECLTVVLDESLYPLLYKPDAGYPEHQALRKVLTKHWRQHHHFIALLEYGIQQLPKYLPSALK